MPTISEKGRDVLNWWQDMGVIFDPYSDVTGRFNFTKNSDYYSIPAQLVPEGVSLNDLCVMQTQGLLTRRSDNTRFLLSVPEQPIPKELLEMEEQKKELLISHPEERMLWLQQRIAGTNEQWKVKPRSWNDWKKIPIDEEPEWSEYYDYTTVNTVKYYFCVIRRKDGSIGVFGQPGTKEELESSATFGGATIIGNIEERDVEV